MVAIREGLKCNTVEHILVETFYGAKHFYVAASGRDEVDNHTWSCVSRSYGGRNTMVEIENSLYCNRDKARTDGRILQRLWANLQAYHLAKRLGNRTRS